VTDQLREQDVDIGDLSIHYHQVGSGPTVIMLHGGGPGASGLSNFSKNAGPIAKAGFQVILMDLPGFGGSSKVNPPVGVGLLKFMASTLTGFIDKLGVTRAHLVGNSLGGGTALKAALDSNEKVGKLVLMGPAGGFSFLSPYPTEGLMRLINFYAPPGPSVERMREFIRYLVFDPSQISDDLLQQRVKEASEPEILRMVQERVQRGFKGPEELWREGYERVGNDALLIWGREDRTLSLDQALIISKLLPNCTLHVMPKTGHWAQWEQPEKFNRLVIDFLLN
jgi:4,5:9,10-diseco-3-hydroxy-5,9,17-trioxoandrosta-1(10),2-diene-4-oate hydrolase